MWVSFSHRYHFQNNSDLKVIETNFALRIIKQLKENRASVIQEKNRINWEIPLEFSLDSTKSNLFHRLFHYGIGEMNWEIEKEFIKISYRFSLIPILTSVIQLFVMMSLLLVFFDVVNFSQLLNLGIPIFIFSILMGVALSKSRLKQLIIRSLD
ncbi:MAG: hypothetical protein CL663_02500 [Bacteroidetes bacterium]|nr:hypothetical protein [Bacteroidota bacterium]